jgi:genome maintenance exonuclease 1
LYKIDFEDEEKNLVKIEKIYPSVTSITYLHIKEYIESWIKSCRSSSQPESIRNESAARGTRIHKLIEDYLANDKKYDMVKFEKQGDVPIFNKLIEKLANITDIVMQEQPLYSDSLRVAGTVDCIAKYNGDLAVIDFKTSTKKKDLEKCEHYFMQCAAYAECYKEMYGKEIFKLVILMTTEECKDAQVFVEENITKKYLKKFCALRRIFFKENKI